MSTFRERRTKLKPQEEKSPNNPSACFTDFDDRFHARLSHVIPRQFGTRRRIQIRRHQRSLRRQNQSRIPKRPHGLSSYIATGIENVPIFIKADNAENEIEKHLNQLS